MFADIIKVFIS